MGASILVEVNGKKYVGKTGSDGTYELSLPPGLHTITIFQDGHKEIVHENIQVNVGQRLEINEALSPTGQDMTVTVVEERNREIAGADLDERKSSTATHDIIGTAEMKKSGGGDVTNVASRIVGATIIDGRYVFVRGLGHRYGNLLLDGARVPSPEPELRTIPLDLFPSGALSSINVQKTASPDIPGDFAGGSTQLITRDIPNSLVLSLGIKVSGNTQSSFQPMLTNDGHPKYDRWGFGHIPRGMPSQFPFAQKIGRGVSHPDRPLDSLYSNKEIESQGEALDLRSRVLRGKNAPANTSFSYSAGNGWDTKRIGRMGVLFAGGYGNKYQTKREHIEQFGAVDGVLDTQSPLVDFDSFKTTRNVAWNTLGLYKWSINPNHKVGLMGMYSHDADDETRELVGVAPGVSGPDTIMNTRLRYVMRSVSLAKFTGSHVFPQAKDFKLDYFVTAAQARRDDPAMRSMLYRQNPDTGEYRLDDASGSGSASQTFLNLTDNTKSGALNLTQPFRGFNGLKSSAKIGGWAEDKTRLFLVKRYEFSVVSGLNDTIPLGTNNILNADSVGGGDRDGGQPFVLRDSTRVQDSYVANQRLYAGYGMLTLPIVNNFTLSGGARLEHSKILIVPIDPYERPDVPDPNRLKELSVLPSASATLTPKLAEGNRDMNIRLSGSQTVARPEFRELAPFQFTDFVGGNDIQGNPDLVSTKIWNADLRWEWFPKANEVIAVSLFYKYFDSPIERIIAPRIPLLVSFANADKATNLGFELEFRKGLGFLAKSGTKSRPVFDDLSIGANFAYTISEVTMRPSCALLSSTDSETECSDAVDVSTSSRRPLQGQSPFVLNAYLDYNNTESGTGARVLFNSFGRRIYSAGAFGLPDHYQESFHSLDLVFSQRLMRIITGEFTPDRDVITLNAGVKNILGSRVQFTQGPDRVETYGYNPGRSFSASLGWKH